MKNLQEVMKEFDKEFAGATGYCNPHYAALIKNFFYHSFHELLEEILPEEEKEEDADYWLGRNSCRSEVEERIKKLLK